MNNWAVRAVGIVIIGLVALSIFGFLVGIVGTIVKLALLVVVLYGVGRVGLLVISRRRSRIQQV